MPNILDATGLTTATQSELLTYFTKQMQIIYGSDINISSDTADGQLLNIFIQSILDVEDLVTQIYNSFDPDLAIGNVLDQRVAINGIQRQAGTYTLTNIDIVTTAPNIFLPGLDQTLVPAYTVSDSVGNQWQLQFSQTAVLAGSHTYTFQAASPGAVVTIPNTINVPVTIVIGVSTINNPSAAIVTGLNEETDANLRIRRQQSVSTSSQGYLAGLLGTLENINGVTSVFVYENRSATPDPQTGVPGHSIWVIVAGNPAPALSTAWNLTTNYSYGQIASFGGINYISWQNNNLNNTPPNPVWWGVYNPVAQSIYNKRNAGCGMFGAQVYSVTQVDQTVLQINWDIVLPQNLFIQFTATSINGQTAPNIQALLDPTTGIAGKFRPGVYGEVNINQLATIAQQIDPNTLVTFGGVPGIPFPVVFFNGGFTAALNQVIIFETLPTAGSFQITYNNFTSPTVLPFNASNAAVLAVLVSIPGLVTATLTGDLPSQNLNITIGVNSAQGLITISNSTLADVSTSLVQISYNEIFQNTLLPNARNYQFNITPADIIITPMISNPPYKAVAKTASDTFTVWGGYGTSTFTYFQNTSGAGALVAVGNTVTYTAGAATGLDIIQATDLCGNKVLINVTVF